jgi:phenylacetate-CoA ligase
VRIISSPGTTEQPLVVGYTGQDVKLWLELLARLYTAAGVTPEDIVQLVIPPGLANWRRDLMAGAEYLGASVIPAADLNFAKELMVMRDYKTSVLVTTPPLARHLLTVMDRMDLAPTELSLKRALLVAAPLPAAVRREIEAGLRGYRHRLRHHRGHGSGPGLSAAKPTRASISPRTTSTRKSSTPRPARSCPPARKANWSSPLCPPWPSPWCASGPATAPASYPTPAPAAAPWCAWAPSGAGWTTCSPWAASRCTPIRWGASSRTCWAATPRNSAGRCSTEAGLEFLALELIVEEHFFSDEIKALEGLCRRVRRHFQDHLGIYARLTLKEMAALRGTGGPQVPRPPLKVPSQPLKGLGERVLENQGSVRPLSPLLQNFVPEISFPAGRGRFHLLRRKNVLR